MSQTCGFHVRNPFTKKMAQCFEQGTSAVTVPITTSDDEFFGEGVETIVCEDHAVKLKEKYGAVH